MSTVNRVVVCFYRIPISKRESLSIGKPWGSENFVKVFNRYRLIFSRTVPGRICIYLLNRWGPAARRGGSAAKRISSHQPITKPRQDQSASALLSFWQCFAPCVQTGIVLWKKRHSETHWQSIDILGRRHGFQVVALRWA